MRRWTPCPQTLRGCLWSLSSWRPLLALSWSPLLTASSPGAYTQFSDPFHAGIRVCSFYSHIVSGVMFVLFLWRCVCLTVGILQACPSRYFHARQSKWGMKLSPFTASEGSRQQETSESIFKKVWCAFAGLQRRPRLTAPTCSAGRTQSYRQPNSCPESTLCPFRCANLLSPPSQHSVSLVWHACQRQRMIESLMRNVLLVALLAESTSPISYKVRRMLKEAAVVL